MSTLSRNLFAFSKRNEVQLFFLNDALQKELGSNFQQQKEDFCNSDEIPFNGQYKPETNEIFFLEDFAITEPSTESDQQPLNQLINLRIKGRN